MAEYIERRFAVDAIADTMAKGFVEDRFILPQELQDLQDELEMLPAADVAPVVHGRWAKSDKFHGYVCCSICNNAYVSPDWLIGGKWGYCPNCGAKMDMK